MKPRYVYKWGVGPVRIREIRQRFRDDAKRLRRARRLYAWLVYDAIINSETEKVLWDCAQRLIDRQLYSPKAGLRDVRNGLLGLLHKTTKRKGWKSAQRRVFAWHEWTRVHDFSLPGSAYDKNRVRHQRHFEVA